MIMMTIKYCGTVRELRIHIYYMNFIEQIVSKMCLNGVHLERYELVIYRSWIYIHINVTLIGFSSLFVFLCNHSHI